MSTVHGSAWSGKPLPGQVDAPKSFVGRFWGVFFVIAIIVGVAVYVVFGRNSAPAPGPVAVASATPSATQSSSPAPTPTHAPTTAPSVKPITPATKAPSKTPVAPSGAITLPTFGEQVSREGFTVKVNSVARAHEDIGRGLIVGISITNNLERSQEFSAWDQSLFMSDGKWPRGHEAYVPAEGPDKSFSERWIRAGETLHIYVFFFSSETTVTAEAIWISPTADSTGFVFRLK